MSRDNLYYVRILLAVGLVATVVTYWIGLKGPFLLDDEANLKSIPEWLSGNLGLQTLLLERGAGMFGRAVSMATFAFNAWLGGYTPFSFKLGNLIIHMLCGGMIFVFLRRLVLHDSLLKNQASIVAATVATLWLLHPLHASTVLYAVQRMAQLSAFLILIGLWTYLVLRERLQQSPSIGAASMLLLGIPALTVVAFLAKENGMLLPVLCTVVELAWFGGRVRPKSVRLFHILYVAFPVVVGSLLLALRPDRFLGGYRSRDFSLTERLLSQGRALCDYLWKLIAPNPPKMGVYTDDFAISTGLLSPPSTLLALLVLLGLTLATWYWRKKLPSVFFGWLFFLVAHSLEAGPVPLELYFEHRNYLPSMGILLALVALAFGGGRVLAAKGIRPTRIGIVTLAAVLIVFIAGTHGRARVWRDPLLIAESSLQTHPDSLRANSYVLAAAINYRDMERIEKVLENLKSSPHPRNRSMAHAYSLYVGCVLKQDGDPSDLEAFVTLTPLPLTLAEYQPFNALYQFTAQHGCGRVTDQMIGNSLTRLADRAVSQPDPWRIRYQAASFLARSGDWEATLKQAQLAWQPAATPSIATPLVLAQIQLGDFQGAEQTFQEASDRSDASNAQEKAGLRWLRGKIDSAKKAPEPNDH